MTRQDLFFLWFGRLQWSTAWVLVFFFPFLIWAHQCVPSLVFRQRFGFHFSLAQQHSFNNCCSTRPLPPAKEFANLAVFWLTLRRCPR